MSSKLDLALKEFNFTDEQFKKVKQKAVVKTNTQMAWTLPALFFFALLIATFSSSIC